MGNEQLIELHDQGRLAGVLHLPEPSRMPCPIIIYCPGKNGERYEVHRLAVKFSRELAQIGIGFLRFDYYGVGLSDGCYHEMTTSTKVSNVIKAFEYVTNIMGVSPKNICYLGFSDGARVALLAANRTNVNQVLLWSPLFYEFGGSFPGKLRPRFSRHPKYRQLLVMPWAGLWVGIDFYRDLSKFDISNEIQLFPGNSMIIYGDDDLLIQEEFDLMCTNRSSLYINNENNKVESVSGAGHLFTSQIFEKYLMELSTNWLQQKMCIVK